jgi:hypothetical protein
VQFGRDEIIYPSLESYICAEQPPPPPTPQEIKEAIRKTHGYLLDYFDINDIYLAGEVETVGVVK